MSDYGKILMSTANAVGASLKKKMGSLTGFAPVDWAETINKLGNKLPERTVSGAVCSFSDGADDVPMPSVKASITAVQAGSGDPSPSNVRAISGFAECDVYHTKKNLFYTDSSLFPMSENGIACPAVSSGNKNTILWDGRLSLGKWTIKENAPNASNSTHQLVLSKNGTTMRYITTDAYTFTVDSEDDSYRVRLYVYANNTETYVKPQLEKGDTATTYEPYHGEIIPVWMGGKNLLDPDAISEIVINSNNDKRYGITVTKAGTYTLSCTSKPTNHYFYVKVKASDGTYGTGEMINATTPRTKTIVSGETLLVYNAGTGYTKAQQSALIIDSQTMLEAGQTRTTFEPVHYIYGGELNLTTGVLTVTHGYVDLGSLAWTRLLVSDSFYVFYSDTIDNRKISTTTITMMCSKYKVVTGIRTALTTDLQLTEYNGSNTRIAVRDDSYTDSDSFKTAVTGIQLVYELATPTTIQLTPEEVRSFLGINNLWANTGDSEVTYFAQPSGGITPVFTEEVICDNSSASSTLTFTEDWHDYDFLQFKLTNSSSGIITYITTTPDILDEIFARSSSKVLFNEFSNDQYALYTKSSDLSWSRTGTRNVNVTEVKGLTATNCTVSTEWIYKRGAITASNVTITAPKYFEAYDEIYMASCDGDSDDTMPCILPVRAGCAGYNFYGNNGRNCVRLTGNTASDTYGKDETKNIFAMMGINYEEV